MAVKRGDLVTVSLQGDYGKPDEGNNLRARSQIMLDKPMTVKTDRIGPVFGALDEAAMISVSRSLALFLGLAD